MYSVVFGTVKSNVLDKPYRKQGRVGPQPESFMSYYSLLYIAVYSSLGSTVYSVQCCVQYRIGVWGVHEFIGW